MEAGQPAADDRHLELEVRPARGKCQEAVDARSDLLQRKRVKGAIGPLAFRGDRVRIALQALALPVDRATTLAREEGGAFAVAAGCVAAENEHRRHLYDLHDLTRPESVWVNDFPT